MALEAITKWVQEKYQKPHLDPEWTRACVDFLQTELQLNPATQFDEITHHVHLQLLQSDLSDSMLRTTGFPAGLQVPGGMKKGVIGTRASGGAILVQIVGIMEVANSAFTLGNVHQARLDKADMTGLTRDREEGGEGEGGGRGGTNGVEEEEDAIMPPYPRSMLSLLLNDGTATIKAMENKRLGGLVLGETPLGFKLLLKCVPVRNGIAMLEPGNVELLGYQNDELQSSADFHFMNALRKRMGKPEIEAPDAQLEGELEVAPEPPARANTPPSPPPPARAANQSRPTPQADQSDYFDDFTPPPEEISLIHLSPPLGGPASTTIPRNPRPDVNPAPARQACPSTASRKGVIHTFSDPPAPVADDSFGGEDISMEMDEEFWLGIDAVEEKATGGARRTASSGSVTGAGGGRRQSQARGVAPGSGAAGRQGAAAARTDIIELDDSEEEKETVNAQARARQRANARVVDMIDLSD